MKKVGRYVVISELGRGAMGIVYKASDPTIDRDVALKVISLNATSDDGTSNPQQMFMREVRAAGRLAHPAIVTIHDAFDDQENQTSCIVMELVRGETLEKILESGRVLTVEQSLSLTHQVAEALDYAHRNQVIHRDLKPANILVTEDGRAKITDFGIAKILAREGAARTVGVMGTPSYMSPEQVKGGEIDARSDIFSLGIIFYSMLTGKKPFSGNTAAVMFKIVYEEPPAPSGFNPEVTPAHDFVVQKCLAKDRNQRYSSARELLGDLDDLQFDRAPRSQTATPAPAAAVGTPSIDRTMAMQIPGAMKAASQPPPQRPAPPVPPPKPAAPPPVPETGGPDATAPAQHTMAMPIAGLMKAASQQLPQRPAPPVPPPKPAAPPPVTEAGGPDASSPAQHTMAMPIAGLMKAASQQPPQRSAPPVRPPAPPQRVAAPPPRPTAPPPVYETEGPDATPPPSHTMAMPIQGLMKAASQQPSQRPAPPPRPPLTPPTRSSPYPDAQPLTGETLPMRVPDLSALSPLAAPPKPPKPAVPDELPMGDRTLPMQVPNLSAAPSQAPSTPRAEQMPPADSYLGDHTLPMRVPNLSGAPSQARSTPRAEPLSPAPANSPFGEQALPPRAPNLSAPPAAAGIPTVTSAPPSQPIPMQAEEPASSAVVPAHKSKLIPALIAGVAFAVLAAATLGYWMFHSTRTAPSPTPQVAVQTPPPAQATIPAPTPAPVATPPPQPVTAAAPPPPLPTTPEVGKKTTARNPKQAVVAHAPAPTPAPPPQSAPVAAAPAPQPAPPTPSPEDIAKAETARLAKIPRIVKVLCNFGLKEATIVFSAGGTTLFEEPLKGKKTKERFLGIKGSYQGTFSQTITVPGGASEVSVRVVSKDGATDRNQAIKMPPPGGFVPTLAVAVDSEHMALNWQNSSAAN